MKTRTGPTMTTGTKLMIGKMIRRRKDQCWTEFSTNQKRLRLRSYKRGKLLEKGKKYFIYNLENVGRNSDSLISLATFGTEDFSF